MRLTRPGARVWTTTASRLQPVRQRDVGPVPNREDHQDESEETEPERRPDAARRTIEDPAAGGISEQRQDGATDVQPQRPGERLMRRACDSRNRYPYEELDRQHGHDDTASELHPADK